MEGEQDVGREQCHPAANECETAQGRQLTGRSPPLHSYKKRKQA
jgi:hypothetical protein